MSPVSASASSAVQMTLTGISARSYYQRSVANIARKTISGSIEFGASGLLQRDEQFTPSTEQGFRRRAEHAANQAFFAREGNKNELAYRRLAAAFGTAWLTEAWHPWQKKEPGSWTEVCLILGRYVLRRTKQVTPKAARRDGRFSSR